MATKTNLISEVLLRHGVSDPEALVMSHGSDAPIKTSDEPDVYIRGSIQLMKDQMTDRKTVNEELEKLKYL